MAFDFGSLTSSESSTYWYVKHIPTNRPVYFPFRRDYEQQPMILYDDTPEDISDCSYWVEGVANKILRKMLEDSGKDSKDFIVVEYIE